VKVTVDGLKDGSDEQEAYAVVLAHKVGALKVTRYWAKMKSKNAAALKKKAALEVAKISAQGDDVEVAAIENQILEVDDQLSTIGQEVSKAEDKKEVAVVAATEKHATL